MHSQGARAPQRHAQALGGPHHLDAARRSSASSTRHARHEATVGRLLQNQTDIGNAVKPFYGKAAGNALTAELRKHILIAADVIAAAKAGDQAKLADAQARWEQNADDIADAPEQASTRATGSSRR